MKVRTAFDFDQKVFGKIYHHAEKGSRMQKKDHVRPPCNIVASAYAALKRVAKEKNVDQS